MARFEDVLVVGDDDGGGWAEAGRAGGCVADGGKHERRTAPAASSLAAFKLRPNKKAQT